MSARPSRGSWPHGELRRRPPWQRPHAAPPHFATPLTRFVAPYGAPPRAPVAGSAGSSTYASAYPHIPHTFYVHIGSPTESPNDTVSTTEDPSGSARMQFHFGTLFARFVAPLGAPPKTPVAAPACGSTLIPAHPSHVSWPHREFHRRPERQRPRAVPLPFQRSSFGSFSVPRDFKFLVKAVLFLLSSCPHPLPPSLSVAIFPFLPPPFSSCVLRFRSSWHDTIVRGPLGPCQNDSTSSSASSSSSPSARNSS